MRNPELERALRQLPVEEKREIAAWLLQDLHEATMKAKTVAASQPKQSGSSPNYQQRRREIFGDKVIPNMVLESRNEDRW